eukprot:1159951-Pelagomonas_calceolata.AAC.7
MQRCPSTYCCLAQCSRFLLPAYRYRRDLNFRSWRSQDQVNMQPLRRSGVHILGALADVEACKLSHTSQALTHLGASCRRDSPQAIGLIECCVDDLEALFQVSACSHGAQGKAALSPCAESDLAGKYNRTTTYMDEQGADRNQAPSLIY